MSGVKKRKRGTSGASLQSNVLSVFHETGLPQKCDGVAPRERKRVRASALEFNSPFSLLLADLTCVSKEEDMHALQGVERELERRSCSATQFAKHVFGDAEVDFMPSLCVIAHFLKKSFLRVRDLDSDIIIQRAAFEMNAGESCACRGENIGIKQVVRFVMEGGQGNAQDTLLRHILSVLFHESPGSLKYVHKASRFQLADLTLTYIRDDWTKHGEHSDTLVSWVRQAVLPTRMADIEIRGGAFEFVSSLLFILF